MKVNVVLTGVFMVMLAGMIYMRANSWGGSCPPGVIPECPFPDSEFSVFFPHPEDCEWFFHCRNGVAYCMKCPPGLHWNKDLDTCDFPYRAKCADRCVPSSVLDVCIYYDDQSGTIIRYGFKNNPIYY